MWSSQFSLQVSLLFLAVVSFYSSLLKKSRSFLLGQVQIISRQIKSGSFEVYFLQLSTVLFQVLHKMHWNAHKYRYILYRESFVLTLIQIFTTIFKPKFTQSNSAFHLREVGKIDLIEHKNNLTSSMKMCA